MEADWYRVGSTTELQDFTGWTGTAVVQSGSTLVTTGALTVTLSAATSPSVSIAQAANCWAAVEPGLYEVVITARHTASGKDWVFREDRLPTLMIRATPA